MKWPCEVCGKLKPDDQMSVMTHKLTKIEHLPGLSIFRNVKHCDMVACILSAADRDKWIQTPEGTSGSGNRR
jgi:hypothetical protein